jgi:hypothetical protein
MFCSLRSVTKKRKLHKKYNKDWFHIRKIFNPAHNLDLDLDFLGYFSAINKKKHITTKPKI